MHHNTSAVQCSILVPARLLHELCGVSVWPQEGAMKGRRVLSCRSCVCGVDCRCFHAKLLCTAAYLYLLDCCMSYAA